MNILIRDRKRILNQYFMIACLGAIAMGVIYYMTKWGAGLVDWDSFSYISVARNLANGMGYVFPVDPETNAPLTAFPPMLPTLLALIKILTTLDPLLAIRHLNAIFFGLSTVYCGLTIWHATKNNVFAITGSLLFLSFGPFLSAYSYAMSESLYLFLTVASFYHLIVYLDSRKSLHLYIASVYLALTPVTRYIGITNIITVLFILAIFGKIGMRDRLTAIIKVLSISFIPFLLWQIRNILINNSGATRSIVERIVDQDDLLRLFYTIWGWFLPSQLIIGHEKEHVYLIILSSIAIVVLIGIYGYKYHRNIFYIIRRLLHSDPINIIYITFAFAYFAAIMAVRLYLQPINFVDRVLIPLYIAGSILIVTWSYYIYRLGNKGLRILALVLLTYLLIFNIINSTGTIQKAHANGIGLARKSVQKSATLEQLIDFQKDGYPIYSNYPWALYLWTGEIGYRLKSFSADDDQNRTKVIAIFEYSNNNTDDFINEHNIHLELVASDNISSVYLVNR